MRYLFFDIECCNGKDICEFGYIITDTQFNILEKEDITINPDKPFKLTGRTNQNDLKLFYPESVYFRSCKFPYFYNKIKTLIEEPNQLVIGHAISNDAIFLRTACRRYNLEPINFKFADSQRIFSEYFNVRKSISLEAAGDELNVEAPKYLHKSDEDSQLTMGLVKNMATSLECSLEELIDLCESCSGKSENFDIKYDDYELRVQRMFNRAKVDTSNIIRGGNYKLFLQFLDGVKPQGEIIKSVLTEKSLCLSINYEMVHFREMLAIIQLLANHGATYKLKASLNNIFVDCPSKDEEGNDRYCSRFKYVKEAIQKGKNIQILSFEELLSILDVKKDDLFVFPFPDESSFMKRLDQNSKSRKERQPLEYTEPSGGTTLGDLLKAQGVDLSKVVS